MRSACNRACARSVVDSLILASLIFLPNHALGQALTVPVPATSLVYDPVGKKIWACVGSNGQGTMANSIISIDPQTAAVGTPTFIGSEPRGLVLSDQSKYLYTVVSDGRSIRRFDIAAAKPGPQFPIGDGIAVTTFAAVPGNPDAVVVMRHRPGISPNDEGVAVYVNGIAQEGAVHAGHHMVPGIAPTRLYGYENQISTWAFTAMSLAKQGVIGGISGALIGGNVGLSGSANGLVVTNNGGVLDPETRDTVGRLPDTGLEALLLPDSTTGKVYAFSGDGSTVKITVYSLKTFTVEGTFPITDIGGSAGPGNPIRWGDTGLAFTAGDRVVILKNAVGPLLPRIDLAVKRGTLPTITPRSPFSYTLTVTNRSTVPATAAYLSDVVPSGAEVLTVKASQGSAVYASQVVRAELGSIPAGGSATVTVNLQLSSGDDTTFAAVVRGAEPDPAPENNIELRLPNIAASPLPDLTGAWGRAGQVAQGAGANLRAVVVGAIQVRNAGKQPAGSCVVRFYLSDSPVFRAITSQLIQETPIPALSGGRAIRIDLEAPLAPGDDATGLFLYAVIDATDVVQESDKRNNVLRTTVR